MSQEESSPTALEFKSGISPERAEAVIRILGDDEPPTRHVTLSFQEYPYVNTGVGWRIGNALRRYSGPSLEAIVPPFQEGQGEWFRSFTASCLGDAIATHAGRIVSTSGDITAVVRDYYSRNRNRHSQNSVVIGQLHLGLNVNPEREDLFRNQFVQSLRFVNVRPSYFEPQRLHDLIKLTFEAIQNVYDHAARQPMPSSTTILSYVLLRYFKSIERNQPDPAGGLSSYISRLPAILKRQRTDFIEVCVNDDGVGIAARQSQNASVYWGSKDAEACALSDALRARSSVKLRAHDAEVRGVPGQGYTYINASLKALAAFATLRSGRLLAVFDGADADSDTFRLVPDDLGYMPGTTLSVLVPIQKDGDSQPLLFPG